MAVTIPLEFVDEQLEIAVTVEAVPLIVSFQWMERYMRWQIDFRDSDETPIVVGIRLIPNISLVDQLPARQQLPDGVWIATRRDGSNNPISKDDLPNGEVTLAFVPRAEFEAARPEEPDFFGTLTYTEVTP